MGLSLWAHLAKLDSVYRVHRHDWDPVYRVHDPGVYLGSGVGKMWELTPHPTSLTSLHSRWNLFYCFAGGRALLPQRAHPRLHPHPSAWATSLWELGGGWWEHEDQGETCAFHFVSLYIWDCKMGRSCRNSASPGPPLA